jgi:hypothetical protein
MNQLLVRACELVLIRHGAAEADLNNSYGLAMAVAENTDSPSGVSDAIFLALNELGIEEKEGSYDDAEFLIGLAKAL